MELTNLENLTPPNELVKNRDRLLHDSCHHCEEAFDEGKSKIVFNKNQWHKKCFVCAQCLQELEIDTVFLNEERMYCMHDYKILFAPSCRKCNQFVLEGRVIKAMDSSWHADCFTCSKCQRPLATCSTFKKRDNKPYCPACYESVKDNSFMCYKCHGHIDNNKYLKQDGEYYHPYHFQCRECTQELDTDFREKGSEFYCLRCYDKTGIPVCAACKRPVEERVIHALGKSFHVDHFVCSFCNKPFLGTRYYVFGPNQQVYCELHYELVAGSSRRCSYCNREIAGGGAQDSVQFLGNTKQFCADHFFCFACDVRLNVGGGIYKMDRKPICKVCLQRLPNGLRKRLAGLHKDEAKRENHPGGFVSRNSSKQSSFSIRR